MEVIIDGVKYIPEKDKTIKVNGQKNFLRLLIDSL